MPMKTAYDADVKSSAEKMMLDVGYQPKGDWTFIDDLVTTFKTTFADNTEALLALETFLTNAISPLTRSAFTTFSTATKSAQYERQVLERKQAQLDAILKRFNVGDTGSSHEALALHIVDLEAVLEAYSARLRSAESATENSGSGSMVPFIVGVVVGGVLF